MKEPYQELQIEVLCMCSKHSIARLSSSLAESPTWLFPGKDYQLPHLSLNSDFSCVVLPCQELDCSFRIQMLCGLHRLFLSGSLLLNPEETTFFLSGVNSNIRYRKFQCSLNSRKITGSKCKIYKESIILKQFQKVFRKYFFFLFACLLVCLFVFTYSFLAY